MSKEVSLTMGTITIDTSLLDKKHFISFAEKEISLTQAIQGANWEQGKSWDGQSISASGYSSSYAEHREYFKRKTSPVDLIFDGDLKGSAQVRATEDGAESYFMSTPHRGKKLRKGGYAPSKINNAELAQALVAKGFNLPLSQFGRADLERIKKNYKEEISKIIEKLITVDNKG